MGKNTLNKIESSGLAVLQENAVKNRKQKMITIENYGEMVRALAKSGQKIVEETTFNDAHLNHMIIGICGEIGEIAEVVRMAMANSVGDELNIYRASFVEESGDLEFYQEGARQGLSITRDEVCIRMHSMASSFICRDGLESLCIELFIWSGKFVDQVKKVTIYRKVLDRQACIDCLAGLEFYFSEMRLALGVSRKECLEENIKKLSKRYEGLQYSNDAAVARADKSEDQA